MPKSQPRKKTESEAESMEISDEAPAQCSETADEDMCACTESGGGGGHSDRESKGADEAGQQLLGSLPPDERTTSVGLFHFQSCFSASICLTGAAVLIMKPPAANTTADAF